jgi:hypothetical protein
MNSDQIVDDTDDGQTFNFGKNLLREIVSDAFGPNWVWWKESFSTFIISEIIFHLHV